MIFQDSLAALNPTMKVGNQLIEPLMLHMKMNRREAWKKAVDLLDKVGIPAPKDRMKSYAHEFSGGMRQRVMIAMALSCNPSLLLADEPTTALDVFENPLHPYTKGLLESTLNLTSSRDEELTAVKGLPPDLINLPPGCACPRETK